MSEFVSSCKYSNVREMSQNNCAGGSDRGSNLSAMQNYNDPHHVLQYTQQPLAPTRVNPRTFRPVYGGTGYDGVSATADDPDVCGGYFNLTRAYPCPQDDPNCGDNWKDLGECPPDVPDCRKRCLSTY
jgi:hypothetical protein